jgi:hypothetical protein
MPKYWKTKLFKQFISSFNCLFQLHSAPTNWVAKAISTYIFTKHCPYSEQFQMRIWPGWPVAVYISIILFAHSRFVNPPLKTYIYSVVGIRLSYISIILFAHSRFDSEIIRSKELFPLLPTKWFPFHRRATLRTHVSRFFSALISFNENENVPFMQHSTKITYILFTL